MNAPLPTVELESERRLRVANAAAIELHNTDNPSACIVPAVFDAARAAIAGLATDDGEDPTNMVICYDDHNGAYVSVETLGGRRLAPRTVMWDNDDALHSLNLPLFQPLIKNQNPIPLCPR